MGGVYSGCVCNGLGTTRGTLTGIGAAELACGVSSAVTAHFSAEARPKSLPPNLLQQIGGNAILRCKEWRARDEYFIRRWRLPLRRLNLTLAAACDQAF